MSTKIESFEAAVEARAAERVAARIKVFKSGYAQLIQVLVAGESAYQIGEKVAAIMATDSKNKGWPKELWERERATVRKELFAVMDEMQRAFLAKMPVGDDVCTPEEDAPAP